MIKKITLLIFLRHFEQKKTALPSRPVKAALVSQHLQERPTRAQSVRSPVFFLPVYTDSPNVQKHPIYRLSVELIDILSICTSFCCIDCAKEQVGQR
jgi:hypothetical protein